MEKFGKFMAGLLMLIISTLLLGFVFLKLWHWLIMPVFDLKSINMIESIGIMFVIGFIKSKIDEKEAKLTMKKLSDKFTISIIFCLITLLFGFIIHLFY